MHGRLQFRFVTILVLLLIASLSTTSSSAQNPLQILSGTTERVSVASDGTQGNQESIYDAISVDGRYVAFGSSSTNLVAGDTNGYSDVFVHDRQTGETTRISIASDGTQANANSYRPFISADGRYVAFTSRATNLVSGDTNGFPDVFVHDLQTGETSRDSIASDGTQGNNWSGSSYVSADGRYVAFDSNASNLVNEDTNGYFDSFVHDRQTGETTRISIASDGTQGNEGSSSPSISADGRYVAFHSFASNLVESDTNGYSDVFVHDRQTGETTRISIASDGTQGNEGSSSPSISADGRYVAFHSFASNLVESDTNGAVDVFVHDMQTGETSRDSIASDGTQGNSQSDNPSISADGRYVAFESNASNLVYEDTNVVYDVFVHDSQTGETSRVSIASDGTQGNSASVETSISADGGYVAFLSYASNLVNGDTNGVKDVFVHGLGKGGASYSISGHISDPGGNPIPGVSISAGAGYSSLTDSSGNYTISSVITGTYTVTPILLGYTFTPSSRTVSVPPNVTGQDFTGIHDCSGATAPQPVFLIHGFGADENRMANDTFGFRQLYDTMKLDGYVENCNLFYVTGISPYNDEEVNLLNFQTFVHTKINQILDWNPGWNRHFDIIGHSYGGLNARHYLESHHYEEDKRDYHIQVDNLFTLGTPHGGVILPTELYPGIDAIVLGHGLPKNWPDFLSEFMILSSQMDIYNLINQEPDGICYRLIGGSFLEQYNVPVWMRWIYSQWFPMPGDIGVSLRSSLQLGLNPTLWFSYPNVVIYPNSDMHGYFPDMGLNDLHSYVKSNELDPVTTYQRIISPILHHINTSCPGQSQSLAQDISVSTDGPIKSPTLLSSEVISAGQSITGTAWVDWEGRTAIYASWMGGDLDLSLRDPTGEVYTPTVQQSNPNVEFYKAYLDEAGLETYIFTDTIIGQWTYTATATSVITPTALDLYVTPNNLITIQAYAPEWQPFGSSVAITASLSYSMTPIIDATVIVQVSKPDHSESSALLVDNGVPPDLQAGDGIYGGYYLDTQMGGFYTMLIQADGTHQSSPFHRNVRSVFSISPGIATLNNSYADRPVDNNHDSYYEYLNLDVGVNVTQPGQLTLAAVLQADGGQYIDLANTTMLTSPGFITMPLQFSSDAIYQSGLDGPYTITQVLLLDNDTQIKLDEVNNAWVTAPYDHTRFGSFSRRIFLPIIQK